MSGKMEPMRVGLIGCGNISDIYLRNSKLFESFDIVAAADILSEVAARKAAQFGIEAVSVDDMFKRDDIDTILNLTIPAAHAPIALQAITSGKHVYLEKPLAISLDDASDMLAAARSAGVRIGSAPDTVLGAGTTTARDLVAEGRIGKPLIGTSAMMTHGMEARHPSPDFFFKPGGGPVLNMGPYYITMMATILGPVVSVEASGKIGFSERIITAPGAARYGQAIKVDTFTTVQGLIHFAAGAQVSFSYSWDVWRHSLPPLELHGTEASMRVPDPNFFGGLVEIATGRDPWEVIDTVAMPYGALNYPFAGMPGFQEGVEPTLANYRGLGLSDMAIAIAEGRLHRVSGDFAFHVLDVLTGIMTVASEGRKIEITSLPFSA